MITQALHCFGQGLTYANVGVETAESAIKIVIIANNPNLAPSKKAVKIALETLFITANIADLTATITANHYKGKNFLLTKLSSPNTRLIIKCSVAASDLSRPLGELLIADTDAERKKLAIDIGCVALRRICFIGSFLIECDHEVIRKLPFDKSYVDIGLDCCGAAAMIGSRRHDISSMFQNIFKAVSEYMMRRENPSPHGNSSTGDAYLSDFDLVKSAGTQIDRFDHIPMCYQSDPILQQFCCSITGKPIRYYREVAGGTQIFAFERKEIEKQIRDGNQPDSWPENVPFSLSEIAGNAEIQTLINNRLVQLQVSLAPFLQPEAQDLSVEVTQQPKQQ